MDKNQDSNKIMGSNLEDRIEDTKSPVNCSEAVKTVIMNLISEPVEYLERSDPKKSDFDEGDDKRSSTKESQLDKCKIGEIKESEIDEFKRMQISGFSETGEWELVECGTKESELEECNGIICEAKGSKLYECDGKISEAKESKLDECDGKINEAKESKLDECDGKINEAKESKLDDSNGKINEAKESKLDECDGKISEAKESKLDECDGKINEAKESKLDECDGKINEAKESKLDDSNGKINEAKESKLDECDGKIREAKESKLDECDGKINEAKESKLDECDGKINEAKESKLDDSNGKISEAKESEQECNGKVSEANYAKESKSGEGKDESYDTENVKSTSLLSEDDENVMAEDERIPLPLSDSEDCQVTKSKWKSNLEDSLEKGMPSSQYVKLPEFYELGLVGSPEAEESESPKEDLIRVSSNDSVKPEGGACFNWFKRVSNSPQKLILRFRRFTSPKSSKPSKARPVVSSQCHDDSFKSPGLSPIRNGRHFVLSYMGNCSVCLPVDRIDYSKLAEDKIIPAFLGMHPCYDVMPTSGKVIVLSVELLVKNAFSALVTNEIKAAPLWDTGLHDFIGMLTISDFINVLRHYYYSNPEDIKDIENQTISTWRKMTKMSNEFIKINGSDSLAQATKLLIQEGVHRIPVFDEKRKCVLFVLTRKRLLQYLSYSLFEKFEKSNIKTPSFFRKTLRELRVGTYGNIATTTVDGRVIDALDLFVERKVSSLPVVDENCELKDIFEKFDVFVLAKEQTYHNLEMTVLEAITKAGNREGAVICTLDESLGTVINKFVNSKVHRIVVINERRIVVGIVSLSDVLKFLVVQPLVAMEDATISAASDIIEEGAEGAVGGSDAEISVFDSGEQDSSTSLTAEESDKNNSLSEGITDLKISSAPEIPEELDGDVLKSE